MTAVDVTAPNDVPAGELSAVRERIGELESYVGRPILGARLTLRHPDTRKSRSRYVADASLLLDGRLLAVHASGPSALVVVPEPSRYSEPITLDTARSEMDILNHRFLYFIDAADGRGNVLYLRHDGDYGLVEPE